MTTVIVKHELTVAEVVREGGSMSNESGLDPLSWYVDAAWLVDDAGQKIRDLTEEEVQRLEKNAGFGLKVIEAMLEYEKNYDPTPLE